MQDLDKPSDLILSSQGIPTSLRIGLLIDTFIQPQWIYSIVAEIQSSNVARISLVIKNDRDRDKKHESLWKKVLNRRSNLLALAYLKLDNRIFKVNKDAFAPVDISSLITDVPILKVKPIERKFLDSFRVEDIQAIREYNLDVALRFGFRILRGDILRVAKFGVWSYHHADNLTNRGSPAGVWEVLEGQPVTGSVLQVLSDELDGGQVIYRSYSQTKRYSPKLNANNYYWKSATFVMRKLADLYHKGPDTLTNDPYSTMYQPYTKRLYKMPTNTQIISRGARLLGNGLKEKIQDTFSFKQWYLAYQFTDHVSERPPVLYKFKNIIPPNDRFWADPFPVKYNDRYFIFFEEYISKQRKGRLAVIEIDENGTYRTPVVILEKDYHLSYPFIFTWQGQYYLIPESSSNRSIDLYRCVAFPYRWELEKVLFSGLNAVDTTLVEIDDLWWMFTSIAAHDIENYDELYLFYANTPLGPWSAHPNNPVKSDIRGARPSGNLFHWKDQWYRPAQDGSRRYGYAVRINRIDQIDLDNYRETEVSSILPEWSDSLLGVHTLNMTDRLIVVDALRRCRKY